MAVPDFAAVMSDLTQFQNELDRGVQTLTNPREKEVMLDLMAKIRRSRAQVEELWPSTMQRVDADIRRMKSEAEAQLAGLDAKKAKADAVAQKAAAAKAAAAAAKVKKPKSGEVKVDLTMGTQLKQEILARFINKDGTADTAQLKEIWEDWDWPGSGAGKP